ncbi:MAG: glycosyltransferase [Candidatus Omnitrophica bacterium]|nr:glycosyltransferase [Candidatus Omnitrophota bacterium]
MTFSVGIPTYNRIDELKRCLASLREQTFRDFSVVVANGGDEAAVREAVAGFSDLTVRVVTQQKRGIVAARNLCWRASSADVVCIIDDDIVVSPRWLEEVRLSFLRDERIAGVSGPTLIPEELSGERDLAMLLENQSGNPFLRVARMLYLSLILENKLSQVGRILKSGAFTPGSNFRSCLSLPGEVDVDYLEACHMCFRRQAVERAGGFDDFYGIVGDWSEPDLSFKIRRSGGRLVFNPRAVTWHRISRSGAYGARTNSFERSNNFVHFYRRWIKPDSLEKCARFGANLVFINLYWFYKFLRSGNSDWLRGISGMLAGFREKL